MIWSTYHVFGSGSAGIRRFAPPTMTVGEYIAACERLAAVATDDGDDGFGGTMSVPDEAAAAEGIVSAMWASPGLPAVKSIDGMVTVGFRLDRLRKLPPELTLGQLAGSKGVLTQTFQPRSIGSADPCGAD